MSDLEALLTIDWESFGTDQYETLETNDGARRIPTALFGSGNYDAGKAPYHKIHATGFGYNLRGFHPDISGSDNGRASGFWYRPSLAPTETLVAFAQVRIFGGYVHMGVGPAVRMDTATNPGRGCYTAELTWNAVTIKFDLEIVKYDATTGARSVLATLAGAVTQYPNGSGNFGDRYYAIGLKATGTSTVTLSAFLHMMYFTQTPSYNPFAPGTPAPRHLSSLPANIVPVLTATDASSPHSSGAHGARWRDQTGSYNQYSTHTQSRLLLEWGLFQDVSATRPSEPANLTVVTENATTATVYVPGFSDTDPLDSHASTRYLLYVDSGVFGFDIPVVDTGFLTGSKTSHQFESLAPGAQYYVRAQFRDSDGDVSSLSNPVVFQVSGGKPKGLLAAVDFHGSLPFSKFPRALPFTFVERAGITDTDPVFKLREAGFTPGTGPTVGQGPTLRRFDSVGAGQRRGVVWRIPAYVPGLSGARYGACLATMCVVKWGTGNGLEIGVRHTAADAEGYYLHKHDGGVGYWTYQVLRRTLSVGGVAGVGPYTDTLLFEQNVLRVGTGRNGERVILASYDSNGTAMVALWINGQLIGEIADAAYNSWLADASRAWSSIAVNDANGDWDIASFGHVEPTQGNYPELPISVPVPVRNTGSLASGAGFNHVGHLMDPFDVDGEFCAWFSVDEIWSFMDSAGTGAYGFLLYWAPYLATYNYAVRAPLYNRAGLIVRYSVGGNYITAVWNAAGTRVMLTIVVGGAIVATYEAVETFAAGSEMVVEVANDTASNATAIQIRVFYDSSILTFGPVAGPYTDETVIYDGGASSPLRSGRFGVVRNGSNGATNGEYVAGALVATAVSAGAAPTAPTIQNKYGDAPSEVSVILAASSFLDPDAGSTHAASQWQVALATDPTFSSPVYDSGVTGANLTSVVATGLLPAVSYIARVRYRDEIGLWSGYSASFPFTTDNVSAGGQPTGGRPVFPLDPKPSQTFVRTATFDNSVTRFLSGRREATSNRTGALMIFSLKYGPIATESMDTLWNFYLARQGRLETFVFIDQVSGNAYLCEFAEDRLSREMFEWKVEQASLELNEVTP